MKFLHIITKFVLFMLAVWFIVFATRGCHDLMFPVSISPSTSSVSAHLIIGVRGRLL